MLAGSGTLYAARGTHELLELVAGPGWMSARDLAALGPEDLVLVGPEAPEGRVLRQGWPR